MGQPWFASSYRTADILAAFSQASAEADAIDLLLHAGPAYCPDADTPTQSRRLRVNDDALRRIDRVLPEFYDALTRVCHGRFRVSGDRETHQIPAEGAIQSAPVATSSAELISHFAFPHVSDRDSGSGCAFRTRNDPA